MNTFSLAQAITRTGILSAATVLLTSPALAQSNVVPEGRLLASNCYQCHGTNGKGPGFDRIAGKAANEIYQDLKEMQSGKEGKGIMPGHTLGYTDAQLLQISSWLAQLQ